MKISDLIKILQDLQLEHGDLKCVVEEPNEDWGSITKEIMWDEVNIGIAQPGGPKSGKSENCLIIMTV